MRVETDIFQSSQGYEARGIVARINKIGHYDDTLVGAPSLIGARKPIYQFLTFDAGKGKPSFAAEYVREAKIIVNKQGTFLDPRDLKEGEIVVSPGFVYKKIPWTTKIMNCHLDALKKYRPKSIIKADVDQSAGPIDLGTIDPLGLTKQ